MTTPNESSTPHNSANPSPTHGTTTSRLPLFPGPVNPQAAATTSVIVPSTVSGPGCLTAPAWKPPFHSFPSVPTTQPNNPGVANSSALQSNRSPSQIPSSVAPPSESSIPDSIPNAAPPTSIASSPESRPARSTHKNAAKDGRRLWHRRALEESGASSTLIKAIDEFNRAIPPIPNQVDHGRKTQVRDMRRWITILQEPQHAPVWHALVSTLKTDSSAKTSFGDKWDHHLCRFILQTVVSEDNSNAHPGGRSQTRQAVNNAIKRELACPTEGGRTGARGKSSRSKTFLELFREKCRAADVHVPPLENSDPDFSLNSQSAPQPPQPVVQQPSILLQTRLPPSTSTPVGSMPIVSSLVPQPFRYTPQPVSPQAHSSQDPFVLSSASVAALQAMRDSCLATDEWGRPSWWELPKDDDVRLLPSILVQCSPFQLRTLLIDFRWIVRTFKCMAFPNGIRHLPTEGYDILLSSVKSRQKDFSALDLEGFRLIRNAIMLIIPILTEDASAKKKDRSFFAHLATQLTGRLLDLKRRFPIIAALVQSVERNAPRPWLRPLSRCFQQPKTDIKLAVPSNGPFTPHLITLSDDGKMLVTSGTTRVQKGPSESTARKVNLIRIWDVESGKCVLENRHIPFFVRELALSRDKTRIMFETVGGLYFWHLRSDGMTTTIEKEVRAQPEVSNVTSIAPTGRSDMALTTHRRQDSSYFAPISLWNTTSGTLLRQFTTVGSSANCIDVSSSGEMFASGHNNGFIHIWNLSSSIEDETGSDRHWQKPSLSFQNICEKVGPQPVKPPERSNDFPDEMSKRTISVSFHDSGEGQWVAAVSSDEIIRVWELPPGYMLENRTKQFVSAICQAVIRRPRTYVAQWARKGRFYTGGDDGLAYEWERCYNGEWRWFAIDRKRGERTSEISTALISVGKNCDLVATYQTKSPYVTVWDMGIWRDAGWVEIRSRAYRSHCAMKGKSVDVMDIQDLTVLKKMLMASGGTGETRPSSQGMSLYGDNLAQIRQELENNFQTLDPKMTTRVIGEMQPRLTMQLPGGKRILEVCFDQPVTWGVSGSFVVDKSGEDWGVVVDVREDGRTMGDRMRMDIDHNMRGESGNRMSMYEGLSYNMYGVNITQEEERRGMVAALQDGSVALFEREDGTEGMPTSRMDSEAANNVDANTSPASGSSGTKKQENAEPKEDESVIVDDSGARQDSGGVGTTGDGNSQGGEESRRKRRRTGDLAHVESSSNSAVP